MWDEASLQRAIEEAEEHGCSSSGDVQPLVIEVRRLRATLRELITFTEGIIPEGYRPADVEAMMCQPPLVKARLAAR